MDPSREESMTASARGRGRKLLGRFRRDSRAATVVEFGIVALPFFLLLFAIIETLLLFFATQTIDHATNRGARLIRTGQAQALGLTQDDFKREICNAIGGVFNCEDNLRVEVRTYDTFATIDLTPPLDENGNLQAELDFDYDPGEAGDIVVVRAFYEWPLHTNLLGLGLANLPNGTHLIAAATAFRNEPF